MTTYEKIVASKNAPQNKYVIWLDTSSDPAVLKAYVQGAGWKPTSKDDAQEIELDAVKAAIAALTRTVESDFVLNSTYVNRGFYLGTQSDAPTGSLIIENSTAIQTVESPTFYFLPIADSPVSVTDDTEVTIKGQIHISIADFSANYGNLNEGESIEVVVCPSYIDEDQYQNYFNLTIYGTNDSEIVDVVVDASYRGYTFDNSAHVNIGSAAEDVTILLSSATSEYFYNNYSFRWDKTKQFAGIQGVFGFLVKYENNVPVTNLNFIGQGSAGLTTIDTLENITAYKTRLENLETQVTSISNTLQA